MRQGYEKPGHLWTKRIPKPGGGYYYVYDSKKVGSAVRGGINRVSNAGKSFAKKSYEGFVRSPFPNVTTGLRSHPGVRAVDTIKSKSKSLAGRAASYLNTDPKPNIINIAKLNPGFRSGINRAEKGIDKVGSRIEGYAKDKYTRYRNRKKNKYDYNGDGSVNLRDAGDYIGDKASKIGRKIKRTAKKYYDRFESSTNNTPDFGDVTRAGRKAYKNAKKSIKRDKQIWEESKKYNSRRIKKLKKNVKKKLNKIF